MQDAKNKTKNFHVSAPARWLGLIVGLKMNGILKWKLYNLYRDKIKGWRSIFYSCFGEDAVINNILNGKKNGFWVDVGAFHPEKYSNTKFFSERGWTGVNVEPNTVNFKLFQKRRPKDINLNQGVYTQESKLNYYRFVDGLYNTFDEKLKDELVAKGISNVGMDTIRVTTLANVIEENCSNRHIDFLNVDVENLDLEVLKSNDWTKYVPSVVCVEDHEYDALKGNGDSKISAFLKEKGYILDSKCRFSLIFRHESFRT